MVLSCPPWPVFLIVFTQNPPLECNIYLAIPIYIYVYVSDHVMQNRTGRWSSENIRRLILFPRMENQETSKRSS